MVRAGDDALLFLSVTIGEQNVYCEGSTVFRRHPQNCGNSRPGQSNYHRCFLLGEILVRAIVCAVMVLLNGNKGISESLDGGRKTLT